MKLEIMPVKEGDVIQLVGIKHKYYFVKLIAGKVLQTHKGIIEHDEIIGKPWGSRVKSHLGNPFYVFQPSIADMLQDIPRNTQIMYPKDIGYIMLRMGIEYGQHVVEAGTGSGAFTSALALRVGDQGKVYSYEQRPDAQNQARKNLNKFGLLDRVDLKSRDIADGFDEEGVDALFLDVKTPYDYISQVRGALKIGGYFGAILPTTNQVIRLIDMLRRYDFAFIEVVETSLRYYKPEPERFRPVDRMVAHTGFLLFARPLDRDSMINADKNIDQDLDVVV
ncbi:MAG: tRNA (adenine-N1)-methyltransferase [Anaerolineaceae bacterium]|nr:tRNA (adenine-N1)-methyltransferase [Anaerolineaceae bacterium]